MYALYEQKLVYQVGAIPTKVVCLTQVVSADELKDDEEYEDIMEDMRLEAGKYGIFHLPRHYLSYYGFCNSGYWPPADLLALTVVSQTFHFEIL